ncbi:nonsense-mediated mRNA decay factor SMG7-like isoform X2 [Pectinophora gossypiella]|uniref:nonsense-mediated mRNA decay factor SMG7-like isoform X2 n=1 Tax=Pectinophora gossypiella TaxID=13191 RepID=UPI00214E565E|nr:nonsense-mediated mRNA decay factor SMG7-like isoform X2 [Pectinophora gossypiella]
MVLNAAVQMLREADELKQKILKFKSGTSMLQERSLWATQQQLQKVYQKVLVLDLDYALDKKVEQDLWNIGFKQQIEALQAISKDRKNPLRGEGQAMLSWVLQAAAGFYLCLLHQICTTFKLDLPFRRRASLLGWVEGWSASAGAAAAGAAPGAPAAARYICQHCLVHLGDLARYRQQLRVAHTFYRHALVVSAHSGQPYNQLALVSWRRGRRLGALYWHVRSLLVRAPFPPAPANLQRTLQAASAGREAKDLPVLPGVSPQRAAPAAAACARLDAHSYVTELIRALHLIHTVEQLETASSLVNSLNSALTALVATDSFESMTLIKMAVVIMWLVQSSTEGLPAESAALTEGEATAAALAESLACGAVLALLLPAYTLPAPPSRALPALKVWLQWVTARGEVAGGAAWRARPQLWPALAHALNHLADEAARVTDKYDSVPLPEDEELHGFLPLEPALSVLRFPNHAAWDTRHSDKDDTECIEVSPTCLSNEPELEARVRARRLHQLGLQLADMCPDHLSYTQEDNKTTFTATSIGGEQLSLALAELQAAGAGAGAEAEGAEARSPPRDTEGDSDDDAAHPPPPIVISEADFREKVREKRVGILKPQGSLERAREERALANTQDDDGDTSEELKGEDKKEARKPRVNIAMAAIMRKQEETNKQVKFVTPPPTPDSTSETADKDTDKPKMIQPKAIKSLANLPIGRKTGGILSLKDKSAGYPHLVNTDPEPPKKEEEKKKDVKPSQGSSQNSQQTYPKRPDQPSPNWGANVAQGYVEGPRMNFPKSYGIQSPSLTYNPGINYPQATTINNQGIRLPVVNPKEIDVRTAALQKQNSRQELFQDGHKFGNHKYQVSGDKKNFLNDLPPRFANQYRYWQTAQDNQFNDNKFRDENFQSNNSLFNAQQRPSWMTSTPVPETYQQPNPWWTPEKPPPNFNAGFSAPMNIQPNFYSPHLATNMATPYPNMSSFNQMPNPNIGQDKAQSLITPPNYMQTAIGQPQMQTLQNLVSSPNFNSSLNNFGSYAPAVGYDSSMYPQFNNKLGYQPLQMKMMDKPQSYQSKELMDMGGLGFGNNVLDMQQRNLNMTFNDPMSGASEMGGAKNLDHMGGGVDPPSGSSGNTYSLFSGAPDAGAWGAAQRHPQQQSQSLWSGPGPSPLERLLEQQKQMKPAPPPH